MAGPKILKELFLASLLPVAEKVGDPPTGGKAWMSQLGAFLPQMSRFKTTPSANEKPVPNILI